MANALFTFAPVAHMTKFDIIPRAIADANATKGYRNRDFKTTYQRNSW